jgi:AraC-like DNA-binding protein
MDHQIGKTSSVARVFRFSTDAFPERKRVALWHEFVQRQVVRLDSAALAENPQLDGVGMALPGLGVVATYTSPSRAARTRETMRDGNDNIRLVILKQAASPAPAAHLGRDLTVEPGSAVVLSNCDLNEITFTASRSRMIAVNLTRKTLRPLLRDFDAVLAHTIPQQIAPLRLLATYIEALLAEPAPPNLEFAQLAVAHIYDLAALAMGATRDAAEVANNRGLAAARLREIKSDITANLSRDDLSVVEIALRQRVTPRYVQVLFENEGTTFTEFVRNARLNRAYRMLIDQRLAGRSISTIAFETGFSDLSYFNRAFRRQFGGTPSDVRAASNGQGKAFLRPLPTTLSKDPDRQGRDDVAG